MPDISISDSAYSRICEIKKSEADGHKELLQISIISGGCSGLSYDLKLVNRQNLTIKNLITSSNFQISIYLLTCAVI